MKIDIQHNDSESNFTTPTITLGRDIVWFVSRHVSVDCCNEVTCFGCVIVNRIVGMNLTALAGSLWSHDFLRRSGS